MSKHTRIVRTDRRFVSPNSPYICYGVDAETDAQCPSFAAAVDRAKNMGCASVSVDKADAPRDAKIIGIRAGVDVVLT